MKVYNPLWTSIVLVMVIISYQSTTMAQIRHKRGISDFFRRLFKKNASGPTVPGMNSISNQAQHHQQASPIYGGGGGAGNYYGNSENQNSALSPDYYTGAASNLNAMYQPYAHAADYVFPGQVHNQQQQQQLQPQQQASNQVQYNYGNYGSIQQQQQQQSIQAAQGGEGPQPQYVYPPYGSVYGQSSNQQQSQQQYYSPSHGASTHYLPPSHQYQSNGGQFQSDESAQQNIHWTQEQPQQQQQPQVSYHQQQQQQQGGSVVADQDGIGASSNINYGNIQQSDSYGNGAQGQYNNIAAASYNRPQYMSAYQPQPQSAQPGPIDQRNYFQAKPYGQSPGTIDVHQVLDQFIRSAGLSPQGDHDSVKSGMYGAESNLKPAVSIKKLISYPFYFSSSGDKPTSYGHSIRRQSNDDVLYKTAIKQNVLSSQQLDQPISYVSTTKIAPTTSTSSSSSSSSSSNYPKPNSASADDELQFIAKHAAALQDFLSKPSTSSSSSSTSEQSSSTTTTSSMKNSHQPINYYYDPSTGPQDNKLPSASIKS